MPQSLLDIPRELRDQILWLVLYSPREPPDGPVYPTARVHLYDLEHISFSRRWVKYEREPEWVIPAAQALVLVNRQIATETKALLARSPVSYSLDVMIMGECTFWPTWLSVPIPSRRIDECTATLRIFGSIPDEREQMLRDSRPGNRNPPPFVSKLYSIVERLLKRGPLLPTKRSLAPLVETAEFPLDAGLEDMGEDELLSAVQSCVMVAAEDVQLDDHGVDQLVSVWSALAGRFPDREIVVNTLRFDCQSPTPWRGQVAASPEIGFDEWRRRTEEEEEAYPASHAPSPSGQGAATPTPPVMRPEWLASYLTSELKAFLQLSYKADWGAGVFYERIGRIQVSLDGVVLTELALGPMLAGVEVRDPSSFYEGFVPVPEQRVEFHAWKERTLRRRRGNGFCD